MEPLKIRDDRNEAEDRELEALRKTADLVIQTPQPTAAQLHQRLKDMISHTYQLAENKDWNVLHDVLAYLARQKRKEKAMH